MKRHNGWSPEIQRHFVEALADTGSVKAACRLVGRSDHGAYLLRRRPEAEEFRPAWDSALDITVRRIEDGAMTARSTACRFRSIPRAANWSATVRSTTSA